MTILSGTNLKERMLVKKVEKAVFEHLGQENFFVTDVSVVDENEIRILNRDTRNVDRVTDVLSYPCFDKLSLPVGKADFAPCDYDGKRVALGSIVICEKRAKEQAEQYGHSFEREFGFLVCHGFLHLLGFDHIEPDDEKIMLAHQQAIMDKTGLKR